MLPPKVSPPMGNVMNRIWGLSLVFSLLLTGCGGGGGGTTSAPPVPAGPAAVQLQATYDPTQLQVTLTWTPPSTPIDGYNLEAQVGTGSFTQLNDTLIPAATTGVLVTFTSKPPELAKIGFRIQAVRNGTGGSFSNIAEIHLPLEAPQTISAWYSVSDGGVYVSWDTPSLLADRYVLERAACDGAGTITGPWTALSTSYALGSHYTDANLDETLQYRYRVTAWSGSTSSSTTGPTQPVAIPPLAPTGLSAQPLASAIGLSWVNRSQTATQIQVLRGSVGTASTLLATLPPTATSYQDTGLSLGYYTYTLVVTSGTLSTTGPWVTSAPINPTGAPTLASTPMAGSPQTDVAALSPAGLWALGVTSPLAIPATTWGNWTSWTVPTAGGGAYAVTAPLALDPQSRPHAVYLATSSIAEDLTHAWFDGTAWQSEVIRHLATSPTYTFPRGAFILDQAGIPRVLEDTGTTKGAFAGLALHQWINGAWTQEPLFPAGTTDWYNGTLRLSVDPGGTLHALIPTWSDLRALDRHADGTWSTQTLPDTRPWGGGYAFADGVWAGTDTAWTFFQVADAANPLNDAFWVLPKVGGAWQAPTLLRSFPHMGITQASVALSPDGTRVAAVVATTNGLYLYTQTPQGWVESLMPIPPGDLAYPYFKVAFDGANHLHILVRPSAYNTAMVDLHE